MKARQSPASAPVQSSERPATERSLFPCSSTQLRFWFEEQLAPRNPALNISARWQVDGELAHGMLEDAWHRLIDRHDALRTAIDASGEEPLQVVEPFVTFTIPIFDLRAMSAPERSNELQRLARIEAETPFDIARAPLFRVARVLLTDTRSVLFVSAHQLVCDRHSLAILMREMRCILESRRAFHEPMLRELPIRFGEFAAAERDETLPANLERERQLVREMLRGHTQFELMSDRARPRRMTSNGDVVSQTLDPELRNALKALAAANGCTMSVVALAVWFTVLYRFSGETDILLGMNVSGRHEAGLERVVGAFNNTIALRGDLSGNPDFGTLIARMNEMMTRSISTCRLPVQQLIEIADPVRDASRNALFSVNIAFEEASAAGERGIGLAVVDLPVAPAGVIYDVNLTVIDRAEGLCVSCDYNTDLFDPSTIARLLAAFRVTLEAVTADSSQPIDRLPIMTEALRHELVVEANRTQAAYPADLTVPQLVHEQARRTPDAIAVSCAGTSLTYAQLEFAAGALAQRILADGRGPGMLIGILLPRSCEMVVAMLAVMKSGCAYVPLDPQYPADRLAFIIADSGLCATITSPRTAAGALALGVAQIVLDDAPVIAGSLVLDATCVPVSPDELAYVIYTSGSTGKPKGVEIPHAALVNLLWAMRERPGLGSADTLVAVTTISFDIAGLELLLPLVTGARVVVATETDVADGHALLGLLRRSNATVMQATPVTWQLLIDAGWRGDPRLKMLCGGEALPRRLADELIARGGELWNMYGPTETTIWSAATLVTADDGPVLIGAPIANTQMYVLDRNGELVPPGVAGELFIGGAGVARGYLGRDELTRERFVPDPFVARPGARLYRTGDIVRARAHGFEFLGRTDHQIKLRGFRIELDEIVASLLGQPHVAQAAVIAVDHADADTSIQAYVVPSNEAIVDKNEFAANLRARIANFLPSYMVPSGIAVLERLPRTPNGKLDRAALPQSGLGASTLLDDPPATATEIRLAAFVAQLLHRETVGRHNDLFGLGLHSLMAVRLVAYVRETFSIAVTIRDVFDNPTIAALSRVVDEIATGVLPQTPSPGPLPIVVHNEGGEQPPLVFFHTDAETHGMYCQRLATGIGISQPVFAAAPHGTATLPILSTIEAMARDYVPRIKALQPTGPYRLGGYCDGALVAFELARILRAQGESVERVVICNAYAPTRLRFPLLDALARWFGLDESRDSHLREQFFRNIALFYSNLNAGPPALVRFLVERLITAPRHRARARQNFIDHPEIYVRPRGTAETRRHFSQLVATVTYHPGVYDGDVTLIWSSGEYPLMGDPTRGDPTKGWASIVTGDVRVITMDSDHIAPLRERSEELGRLVADAIRSPAGST